MAKGKKHTEVEILKVLKKIEAGSITIVPPIMRETLSLSALKRL